MGKLYLFHFRPIEHYPPIQNILKYFDDKIRVNCYTTKGHLALVNYGNNTIIKRKGIMSTSKLLLWLTYLHYNLYSLMLLLIKRPNQVMYFESLSAFAPLVYKMWFNKKASIYVHYHEYTSPGQYESASIIERFCHQLEQKQYEKLSWISHTNQIRMKLFLEDEKLKLKEEVINIMPNYPSRNWAIHNQKWNGEEPLRMVYVGYSLTFEGSYLKEVVDSLKHESIPIQLTIFCLKVNQFLKDLEGKHNNLRIELNKAIDYPDLAKMLSKNHIGLILYKAKTTNYIHNAPNKLFEYLSCGLDVWYPSEMRGIHEYDSIDSPMVSRFDFKRTFKINDIRVSRNSDTQKNISFFAETEYEKLLQHLIKNSNS